MANKIYDQFSDLPITNGQRWILRHPEQVKAYKKLRAETLSPAEKKEEIIKHKYGLLYEDFIKKLEKQDYKCMICSTELIPLLVDKNRVKVAHVDHDHVTGTIRDLLCLHCNTVLGYVKEKKETLLNMIKYLDKWSAI